MLAALKEETTENQNDIRKHGKSIIVPLMHGCLCVCSKPLIMPFSKLVSALKQTGRRTCIQRAVKGKFLRIFNEILQRY